MKDADRLGLDPVMRWIVAGKAIEIQAASSSQMGRFATEVLASEGNLAALADFSGAWIDPVHEPPRRACDMVLQSAGQGGAIDQGRQERDQMDAAVVPRSLFRKILSLTDDPRRRPAPA